MKLAKDEMKYIKTKAEDLVWLLTLVGFALMLIVVLINHSFTLCFFYGVVVGFVLKR